MVKQSARWLTVLAIASVMAAVSGRHVAQGEDAQSGKQRDLALEHGRETVKMLDDVYKTAIVLITDKYVHSEDDLPAGTAFIALFNAVKKKGWHEVRLLDATGEPIEANNSPRDDFEKAAIAAMKSGKDYYEKVVTTDGKRTLRAATSVPVVMKKCVMCHPHYEDAKQGEAIGALSYSIPLRDK